MVRRALMIVLPVAAAACSLLFSVPDSVPSEKSDAQPGALEESGGSESSAIAEGGPSDASDASDARRVTCPDSTAGPRLLPTDTFCIDETEVTAAQYAVFLDADKSEIDVPPVCPNNTDFTPVLAAPASDFPVLVQWCDAYAYCRWAGKRLCGSVADGGEILLSILDASARTDPARNEWLRACVGGDHNFFYPYGNEYMPDACAPEQAPFGGASYTGLGPPATHPDCVGGFPGLYDMTGNAAEWTNIAMVSPVNDAAVYNYAMLGWLECRRSYGEVPPMDNQSGFAIRCCWSP
jgi:formylglycine-generating enzyme required for sulfatase activity